MITKITYTHTIITTESGKAMKINNRQLNKSFFFHGGFQTKKFHGNSADAIELIGLMRPLARYRKALSGILDMKRCTIQSTDEPKKWTESGFWVWRDFFMGDLSNRYIVFPNQNAGIQECYRALLELKEMGFAIEGAIFHKVPIDCKDGRVRRRDILIIWEMDCGDHFNKMIDETVAAVAK